MANTPKVIIGMPCTDIVRAKTTQAIGALIIESEGLIVDFILNQSAEIVSSRTLIVNRAMEKGATHLLFIDADVCPLDSGVLQKMLAHNKPIVAADYHKRKFPLESVAIPQTDEWMNKVSTTHLYEAQFAGTGFMLIDLAMFKDPEFGKKDGKISAWFNFGRDSQGKLVFGEDAWFCHVARDSGYGTWIDPTIKVAHVGEYLY